MAAIVELGTIHHYSHETFRSLCSAVRKKDEKLTEK